MFFYQSRPKSSKNGTGPTQKRTLSSLVTSSAPSLAEGLLFLKSWTVPFCLDLFKSLFNNFLWLGGGALIWPWPQFWAGHLTMKNQSKEKLMRVITSKHIQHGSGWSQPPRSTFPARTLFEHWSTHEQACLEVFQLIKVMPEKNILWVAWTLRCSLYTFIMWISLLQALPFSMCWAEPVNFFIGWDQFHTKNF